ncbi:MAG TPA: hypothetical protein VFL59_16295 [Candidatus Nanopelagicales bacterium]|nr:hypothetical protein [Candidatus Nanopelagicales bacterium]
MALRTGRPRRTSIAAAAALLAGALPLLALAPSADAVVPRTPVFATPEIDAFAQYDGQTLCSPAAKAGTRKLANLLLATYGSASIGISRPCSDGGTSEHKEGRALDWMQSVRIASQKAKVDAFLGWLLKPGADGKPAEMARRLGVMYIGWNNMMWRAYGSTPGWGDLKGCSTTASMRTTAYDTTCHRNHVHLSLSWDGAAGLTSFWTGKPLAPTCRAPYGAATTLVGQGTDLVPVEPVRVLDTLKGTGLESSCRLGAPPSWDQTRGDVVVPVTGVGSVPADGVAAVAIRVTAYRTSGIAPTVYARSVGSSASRAVVTSLSSATYGGATVVPVASDGTIRLWVDRAGADVLVDVVGYVPLAASAAAVAGTGVTHVTRPVLLYDALTTPLAPGETRTVHLAGVGPLPADGLTGAALTLVSARTATSGLVGVLTPSLRTYTGFLRSSTTLTTATQVLTPVIGGDVVLRNAGTSPAPVRLLLNGWTTAGATDGGATMTTLTSPWKAIDSAARIQLSGPTTSTAYRYANLVDGVHVPTGARGVLVAVDVLGGSTAGTLVMGSVSPVAAASVAARQWTHEVVLLPLNSLGTFAVKTTSLGTQVRITVLGHLS